MNDLYKTQFEVLKQDKARFCVLDFIDERFGLIKIGETYITKSNELLNSGWLNGKEYSEVKYFCKNGIWTVDDSDLETYLGAYLDKLLKCYKPRNIIVYEAYFVDCYIDENGIRQPFERPHLVNNRKVNDMLKYLYDYTKSIFMQKRLLTYVVSMMLMKGISGVYLRCITKRSTIWKRHI